MNDKTVSAVSIENVRPNNNGSGNECEDETQAKAIDNSILSIKSEADVDEEDPIYIISDTSDDENPETPSKKENKRFIKKKPKGNVYGVEKILKHKKIGRIIVYKVKWVGFPYEECSWEPTINFQDFSPIEEYYISKI